MDGRMLSWWPGSDIEPTIVSLDTVGGNWAECYLGVGSSFHCPLTGSPESVKGDFVEFASAFRWLTCWLLWSVGRSSYGMVAGGSVWILHCPLARSSESVGGDLAEFVPAFRWLTCWP